MESSFQRSRATDGIATVTVHGEIDFANCDELSACIRDAIEEWSPPVVRIELGRAVFFDSTGLGALIEGYKAATDAGARFIVVNPTHTFRRVLDVTGLSDLFGLDVTKALDVTMADANGEPETARATGA
jgi:anti-sigma B factor antagonist